MPRSLFVFTAASGTGKTSLVKALIESIEQLTVSISHTTRAPRASEVNGIHYHFTDTHHFEAQIASGAFLEYATVFGHLYGTSKHSLQDQLQHNDVILEIDWQGALQIKQILPEAILVFILPPSRKALQERLSGRGQDSQAVIQTRLAGATHEMRHYSAFDYTVINDDFDTACTDIQHIIYAQRLRTSQQQKRHVALLSDLVRE